MNGYRPDDGPPWYKPRLWHVSLALLGIVALVIISFLLEDEIGVPVDTSYRIICAAACLIFIYKLGADYPGERWPQISLWVALLVNVAIFFTPLVNRHASRGEVMLFALPDAVVVLVAVIASYRAVDIHQRATRQTMILGLIVALVFCVGLFAITLAQMHTGQLASGRR
jgi:hypothetical protein